MKEAKNGKKTIGIQIDEKLLGALLNLVPKYGTNVSGVVRMILIDYLTRYENYEPSKTGLEK